MKFINFLSKSLLSVAMIIICAGVVYGLSLIVANSPMLQMRYPTIQLAPLVALSIISMMGIPFACALVVVEIWKPRAST